MNSEVRTMAKKRASSVRNLAYLHRLSFPLILSWGKYFMHTQSYPEAGVLPGKWLYPFH